MEPVFDLSDLVIDDLRRADLTNVVWSGSPSHLNAIEEALIRAERGEVEYLAVRAPDGEIVAKGGVDFAVAKDIGVIWQLSTQSELHGQGIGTMLVAELERRIVARGCSIAMLSVEHDNPRARALYERLGYAEFRQREAGWEVTLPDGSTAWHTAQLTDLQKTL